jgi:hypothetical protein
VVDGTAVGAGLPIVYSPPAADIGRNPAPTSIGGDLACKARSGSKPNLSPGVNVTGPGEAHIDMSMASFQLRIIFQVVSTAV